MDMKRPLRGERTTTLVQGVFALCKSAIGAGALGLACRLSILGWLQGSLLIVLVSILSTTSLYFLSRLAANLDISDYFTLGREAFGATGESLTMIGLILFLFGALCLYIDLSTRPIKEFLCYFFTSLKARSEEKGAFDVSLVHMVTLFIVALIVFPLSAQRDMGALAKASLAGMICLVAILALVLFDCWYDQGVRAAAKTIPYAIPSFANFFGAFSSILFTFVNHFTMPSSVTSMINPTPKRRLVMTLASASVVLAFNLAIGLGGYLHFGTAIGKNTVLMAASHADGTWMNAIYKWSSLIFGIVLILTFPLLLDPCRSTIERVIELAMGKDKAKTKGAGNVSAMSPLSLGITAGLITICSLIALACASNIETMDKIVTFFSGLAGPPLVFVLPALFFLCLSDNYSVSLVEKIAAYILIGFGLLVTCIGTYFNARELVPSSAVLGGTV